MPQGQWWERALLGTGQLKGPPRQEGRGPERGEVSAGAGDLLQLAIAGSLSYSTVTIESTCQALRRKPAEYPRKTHLTPCSGFCCNCTVTDGFFKASEGVLCNRKDEHSWFPREQRGFAPEHRFLCTEFAP